MPFTVDLEKEQKIIISNSFFQKSNGFPTKIYVSSPINSSHAQGIWTEAQELSFEAIITLHFKVSSESLKYSLQLVLNFLVVYLYLNLVVEESLLSSSLSSRVCCPKKGNLASFVFGFNVVCYVCSILGIWSVIKSMWFFLFNLCLTSLSCESLGSKHESNIWEVNLILYGGRYIHYINFISM